MVVYSGKECGQDKQTNSRELVPPKTKVLGDKRESGQCKNKTFG